MHERVEAPSSVEAEPEVELLVIRRQEIELRVDSNRFYSARSQLRRTRKGIYRITYRRRVRT